MDHFHCFRRKIWHSGARGLKSGAFVKEYAIIEEFEISCEVFIFRASYTVLHSE